MGPEDAATLSAEEAAAHLGITVRTLGWLVEKGEITFSAVGRTRRFSEDDLFQYLERSRVEPGALSHLRPQARPMPPRPRASAARLARATAAKEARATRDESKRVRAERAEAERVAAKRDAERTASERAAQALARQAAVVERYGRGLGAESIARELHIGIRTVYTDLERAGIQRRGKAIGGDRSFAEALTREFLEEEYVTRHRPLLDLAAEVGCSTSTVQNWLRRHGIPQRRSR